MTWVTDLSHFVDETGNLNLTRPGLCPGPAPQRGCRAGDPATPARSLAGTPAPHSAPSQARRARLSGC